MKKILTAMVALAIVSTSAFAKTWTNHIGAGLGVPVESIKGENDTDFFQAGVMFDATYIGVHENGFTVKAGIGIGSLASDDVKIQGNDTNAGLFVDFNLGAGYSFVRSERFLFGATAMFDYAFNQYEEEDVKHNGKNYTDSLAIGVLGIGADVFGSFNITTHFGLYANLGIRYLFRGIAQAEIAGSKTDTDLKGNVSVLPTLGVMWKF